LTGNPKPPSDPRRERLWERLREIEVELGTVAFHRGILSEHALALRREKIEIEQRLGG
jgi:hypothetical protein